MVMAADTAGAIAAGAAIITAGVEVAVITTVGDTIVAGKQQPKDFERPPPLAASFDWHDAICSSTLLSRIAVCQILPQPEPHSRILLGALFEAIVPIFKCHTFWRRCWLVWLFG